MKLLERSLIAAVLFSFMACSGGSAGSDPKGEDGKGKKDEGKAEKKADTSGVTERGAEFDPKGSIAARKLPSKMEGKDSLQVKIQGMVKGVCQKKGCWMEIDMGGERPDMMVRFKDYSFFVPKDASGSKACMKGWAYRDTLSVKEQKHYAKDKGKSQAAIDSIQEPKVRLAFKASGVQLKEKEGKGKE